MAHLFRDVNVDETFGVRFLDHLPRVLCLSAQVRSRSHTGTGWSKMRRSVRDETKREERTSMDRSYFAATGMISFACGSIPHQPQAVSLSLGSPPALTVKLRVSSRIPTCSSVNSNEGPPTSAAEA